MRNHNNESIFILGEKSLPILKYEQLDISLEFECNGSDECNNFSEGSYKPIK